MLTFTAAGHPLFVMPHPSISDHEDLLIRIPNAPRRTFRVSLSERSEQREVAFLALRVGDHLVSINVLSWHLSRQKVQASLQPGHSMLVPDILATGPIRVILVPGDLISRYRNIELPLVPELGSLPQQDLGDRDSITF